VPPPVDPAADAAAQLGLAFGLDLGVDAVPGLADEPVSGADGVGGDPGGPGRRLQVDGARADNNAVDTEQDQE
jgi:hypothetical protein